MGTPHADADLATWASILTNIAKIARHANKDILGCMGTI
jgi:hypothetical protein